MARCSLHSRWRGGGGAVRMLWGLVLGVRARRSADHVQCVECACDRARQPFPNPNWGDHISSFRLSCSCTVSNTH
eukprot:1794129-Prymnesium_polylepis.1